ncbi:hypothetical protein BJF78_21500 [Pseudonocardia sp. CNS-139]|nr:hypothetical protein BJF78_21500 [Pseudonocardia sp. CNS-139]
MAPALAAVPALLLPLPWWTASDRPVLLAGTGPAAADPAGSLTGWEPAGPVAGSLLVALAAAAVLLAVLRRGGPARVATVLAGAAGVALGVAVLVTRGPAVAPVAPP